MKKLFMMMVLLLGVISARAQQAYAVFNDGTLTFYCDTQRNSRQGTTYDLNTGTKSPGWYANRTSITKAVFDASFANAQPTTTYYWFGGCKNLTEIQDISNLNTANVTDMSCMFWECTKLTTLDVRIRRDGSRDHF